MSIRCLSVCIDSNPTMTKYCTVIFGIWIIVFQWSGEKGVYKVFFGDGLPLHLLRLSPGFVVDLNDYHKCSSNWTSGSESFTVPLEVNERMSRKFSCSDWDAELVLLVTETFTLGFMPPTVLVSDNVTLMCYKSLWPTSGSEMDNVLRITDSQGEVLDYQENRDSRDPRDPLGKVELIAQYDYSASEYGDWSYNCTWDFNLTVDGIHFEGNQTTQVVINVYLPVTTPEPDKTTAYVEEGINCSADGYPEAVIFWRCTSDTGMLTDGWSSNSSLLFFTRPGDFQCTCTAVNEIPTHFYTKIWKGTVTVLEKEPDGGRGGDSGSERGGDSDGGRGGDSEIGAGTTRCQNEGIEEIDVTVRSEVSGADSTRDFTSVPSFLFLYLVLFGVC